MCDRIRTCTALHRPKPGPAMRRSPRQRKAFTGSKRGKDCSAASTYEGEESAEQKDQASTGTKRCPGLRHLWAVKTQEIDAGNPRREENIGRRAKGERPLMR